MLGVGEREVGGRLRRLAWFVGLWAASVAALGVVAFALRAALRL